MIDDRATLTFFHSWKFLEVMAFRTLNIVYNTLLFFFLFGAFQVFLGQTTWFGFTSGGAWRHTIRMPDYQSREPGLESSCCSFETLAI